MFAFTRKLNRFVQIIWEQVRVGDILHLSCNEVVPADILLLKCKSAGEEDETDGSGSCYVETSNLDGESNLKSRTAVRDFCKPYQSIQDISFDFVVNCDMPNKNLYQFNGYVMYPDRKIVVNQDNLLLRDCVLKNTSYIEGLVIYSGHETKTMLNNKGPRHKQSRLERMMNRDIFWCIKILIVMCLISALGRELWLESYPHTDDDNVPFIETKSSSPKSWLNFVWSFCGFFILYQMIIPISLYVCIEMVKLGQVYVIHRDKGLYDVETEKAVECRALNITEDLGQVEYMFCDKTGTLTENIMEFRSCTIKGIDYTNSDMTSKSMGKAKCDFNIRSLFLADRLNLNLDPVLMQKIKQISDKYLECLKQSTKLNSGKSAQQIASKLISVESSLADVDLTPEDIMIRDFFLLLAICNTAMAVGKDAHEDNLSQEGMLKPDSPTTQKQKFRANQMWRDHLKSIENRLKNNDANASKLRMMHMFQSGERTVSGSKDKAEKCKPIYESESPDEVALVTAAFCYRVRMMKRTKEFVEVAIPGGITALFQIILMLPFDSTRKRMSVVVRCPFSKRIVLFTKGSDATMLNRLSTDYQNDSVKVKEYESTLINLNIYSTKGYRVLCMAKRVLTESEYNQWYEEYHQAQTSDYRNDKQIAKCMDKLECNLELLGATSVEDKLQYRVPETIQSLRNAGIVIWVLTGDKMETAINIANSCSLFNSNMNIIELSLDKISSKVRSFSFKSFYNFFNLNREQLILSCWKKSIMLKPIVSANMKSQFKTKRTSCTNICQKFTKSWTRASKVPKHPITVRMNDCNGE